MIKAVIIGGEGNLGGELIRLLLNHPNTEINFVYSRSNGGKYLYEIHGHLLGETDLRFSDKDFISEEDSGGVSVLFLCVSPGEAKNFLEKNIISEVVKIIDLSPDFQLRLHGRVPVINNRTFIYGLPELNKEQIKLANNIANPGCFATAIQLALLPLAKAGLLGDVYTTGVTGTSYAWQSYSPASHFFAAVDNNEANKTFLHRHIEEIHQSLYQLQQNNEPNVFFVPWRGNFTRGIYTSSIINSTLSLEEVQQLYNQFYENHPFTIVSNCTIDLTYVINTNKCLINIEKQDNKLVIHSVIDNLLKGASGQAVQNMNLMFNLPEDTGLR